MTIQILEHMSFSVNWILNSTNIEDWQYVHTKSNAADDLSWLHFDHEPSVLTRQQVKDQQSCIYNFVAYLMILSSNKDHQPRHEWLYGRFIARDIEQPQEKETSLTYVNPCLFKYTCFYMYGPNWKTRIWYWSNLSCFFFRGNPECCGFLPEIL